jgi:serine protease Do
MKSLGTIASRLLVALTVILAGIGGGSLVSQATADRVAVASSALSLPAKPVTAADLAAQQSVFGQIYAKVNPSVVNIQVIEQATATTSGRRNPLGNAPQSQAPASALGSGFVWDKQGDIVTNNHVVNGASRITVTFADGRTVDAKLVGVDPDSDLAVIRVTVPAESLVPVEVADSTKVAVGDIVIAIGNPFGLAGTMTQGIVSGLERSLPAGSDANTSSTGATYSIPDIIQTDASINPGNSGGVLVDIDGKLVGVTAAIESSSNSSAGVGFVIPSAIVSKVAPALISSGKATHSWLGLSGSTLMPDLATAMNLKADQKGALVVTVTPNSPAAKAGLQASSQNAAVNGQQVPVGGDVITAINGRAVQHFDDVISYLFSNTNPGQTITLTILRGGQQQDVQLTLAERPAQ